ncbi:MAG: valine--tRNA ligase [Candidatus Eremiobacter antarcticus]|nr:valine--tRNA ligase [Candidatus Eremiobacteraeota bacterium]MBC5807678.1 valine--tRNA ligase [Candidatus Eremiobacteraeota bacterium]PZR60500.1 MAG: valine--tRNA ligase [Candidatus Eremiobacter sp. RRmetagenome_bin22]
MPAPLADKYDPKLIEASWYATWEAEGTFHTEPDASKPPFVIVMPPPNITGRAHMGHGSTYAPMDILTRLHRMRGYNAVWLPGQDHAAIATQNVLEKELAKEGLTRHDLGPEKFRERSWQWREEYGDIIYRQFRGLGFGPDWQRDRFTLDEGLSRAVSKVFIDLYNEGLIYRGLRLVNWCPHCESTLSDSEVEHEDVDGQLFFVRYRGEDEEDEGIVVATTRPETIFADVAVAVHPDDARYRTVAGKNVVRPLSPGPIPVITDSAVEPSFGTGALKITPAHDQTDYDIGERHGLAKPSVIGLDAKMNGDVEPDFLGLDRFAARERALERLRERGLLVRADPYRISQATCYRCDTVVEPLLSLQWFVRMKQLAEPALEASRNGEVAFAPERYRRTYEDWLLRIRDWCISRQIWWGHRLPVWYCANDHVTVAAQAPAACTTCGDTQFVQDPDTLDTWFSSALWPFSILGWPEQTPELKRWYPTQVLATAREIIFLWVARMVMMGLHFMGKVPFATVIVTPLILDEQGRKMSKSLGNSLDPMELVAEYGADATRFAIVGQMHEGQDVRFSVARCEDARRFCNKLWQAVGGFALRTFPELAQAREPLELPAPSRWTLADRWIMDALEQTIAAVDQAADRFDFSAWSQSLYSFVWNQVCDVYIEIAKDKAPTRAPILNRVLGVSLALLHPVMPFVSEELWQHLPHSGERIGNSRWPTPDEGRQDPQARADMARLMELVRTVLALRAIPKLPYRELRDVALSGADSAFVDLVRREQQIVLTLARAPAVRDLSNGDPRPAHALSRRMGQMEVLLPVDEKFLERERAALQKEIERANTETVVLERKLASHGFLEKAPPAVVEKEKARLQELRAHIAMSSQRLSSL